MRLHSGGPASGRRVAKRDKRFSLAHISRVVTRVRSSEIGRARQVRHLGLLPVACTFANHPTVCSLPGLIGSSAAVAMASYSRSFRPDHRLSNLKQPSE